MKKRIFSILLAALMLVSLLPVTAWATEFTGWTPLTSAGGTLSAGSYYLSGNVTLESNLTITGDVTLDLNGYVLKGNGSGSVITVSNNATLTLTDSNTDSQTHKFTVDENGLWKLDETNGTESVTGGVITGGNVTPNGQGGGVCVKGTLTMSGGNIVGNTADYGGGGVCVDIGGTSTMSGGTISGNTADYGGGVYNKGTFTMSGGTISGNTAKYYSGGVYVYQGNFTMTGGTIVGNTAKYDGGGVYVFCGTFTMNGGTISGNTAARFGGGVYVYNYGTSTMSSGTFTMSGTAKITGNTAGSSGGGVYVFYGTFDMSAGEISGNAATSGGGVYAEGNGTVKLGGGAITKNVAAFADGSNGGGVYAGPNVTTVILGGTVQITDNLLETGWNEATGAYTTVASNLYLPFVNPDGNPEATVKLGTGTGDGQNGVAAPTTMKVGVTIGATSTSTVFTDSDTSAAYFFSDNDSYHVAHDETNALKLAEVGENTVLNVTQGTVSETLTAAITGATSGDTLKLLDYVETETTITVGNTLTLDLNGKVLKRTGTDIAIKITDSGGNLTLIDSAPAAAHTGDYETLPAGGVITGGCVEVSAGGNFTMTGGTITGNTGTTYGGVYVMNGTFTMTGGSITGNTVYFGGVYVSGDTAQFTMTGGEITGNTGTNGGGVCVDSGSITLGGTAKITGNFKGTTANNLYLPTGKTVTISTSPAPTHGMVVGVTMATPGNVTTSSVWSAARYFTSDSANYVAVNNSTAVELVTLGSLTGYNEGVSKAVNVDTKTAYSDISNALSAVVDYQCIRLLADVTENIAIEKDVTLDLNGHVLKGTSTGSVITVQKNGSTPGNLTLIDTDPTAAHTGDYAELPAGGCITGGTGTENDSNSFGGGVYVVDAEFIMTGGNIVGNTAMFGGGIYNKGGAFWMTGGNVVGNTATNNGGGVYNCWIFFMIGGSINDNTADSEGGGVCAYSGEFYMGGGTVSGNTAVTGGGVYYMNGTVNLGGTAKIIGNTADGKDSNLYLAAVSNVQKTAAINTTTPPADGFLVGVANPVPTEDANAVFTSNGGAADKYGFFSDQGHKVVFAPAHLEFAMNAAPVITYTVTFDMNDHGSQIAAQTVESGSKASKPADPEASGYTFGGWYADAAFSSKFDFNTAITANTTIYAKWTKNSITPPVPVTPTYTVTGADTENGKLTVSRKTASAGVTVTITVSPDEGYKLDTLTVKDAKGNVLTLTKVNDTTYTFKMPSGKVTISATFTEIVDSTVCPQDDTCVYAKFTDADTKAWYHDGVHFCVENGYMQGVSTTAFDPSGTTTRAMIVTMLWRMEGEPVADYAMSFKDVKADQWYTEAIRWAQSTGVVEGYSTEAFGPNDPITREQMATILYRYAKYHSIDVTNTNTLAGYTDVNKVSTWALDAMKWANAVGLVQGRTTTTLVPEVSITRAEAATMVQRYCENFVK